MTKDVQEASSRPTVHGERTEAEVLPFDGAASVARAIRSADRICDTERRALAETLVKLPAPDQAAGRLVAEWLTRRRT